MKVYLDIDGVLLGTDPDMPHRATLAPHAVAFLEFATRHFDVYWLAAQCRGDAATAVDHIVRHAKLSDRELVMTAAARVKATSYDDDRTEALPQDGNFVWFDDEPTEGEMAVLKRCGWLDRWQWTDTREEPEDLLRAKKWLESRVAGGKVVRKV